MRASFGIKTVAAGCLALAAAASVQAAIVSASGSVLQIAAPTSVVEGALESNAQIKAFNEKQAFTLASALSVDWVAPSFSASGTIAAGTVVDSHFVHFDKTDGTLPVSITLSGSLTFDGVILGLIFSDSVGGGAGYLNLSDPVLGAAGTTYPSTGGRRFATGEGVDSWSVSGGSLTFNFRSLVGDNNLDQMRVVTAYVPTPPLPEPASLALVGLALAALGATAHKKRSR